MQNPQLPPVNTVPHSGQMERLGGKRRGIELGADLVNTVPHGGQMERLGGKRWGIELSADLVNTVPHSGQMERLGGKRRGIELSADLVNTVPHGGQMERLGGKRRGIELNTETCIPPAKTVPHGGQMERLGGKWWGIEPHAELSTQWSDQKLVRIEAGAWTSARNRTLSSIRFQKVASEDSPVASPHGVTPVLLHPHLLPSHQLGGHQGGPLVVRAVGVPCKDSVKGGTLFHDAQPKRAVCVKHHDDQGEGVDASKGGGG